MISKTSCLIFVLILVLGMLAGCGYNKNYGQQLPPELPPSVPIVAGDIEDSRRTTFEVDNGFVVGIRTQLSYQETILFYENSLRLNGYNAVFKEAVTMPGTSEKMMSFEADRDNTVIFGEIISKADSTYVNLAVHLGKQVILSTDPLSDA